MKKNKVLLLPHRYTTDSIAMWQSALRNNWEPRRFVKYECPDVSPDEEVAFYGDGLNGGIASEKLGLTLLEESLDWLVKIPQDFVKRRIEFSTIGELEVRDAPRFIKSADVKWFTPEVFAGTLPDLEDIDPSIEVIIQEPVSFVSEFRFFIAEREIRAYSQYKRNGQPSSTPSGEWETDPWDLADAKKYLNEFLREDVQVCEATVIDVGKIEDRGWAIIEANPCYQSGIYDCNPDQVLEVVRMACKRK